MGIGDSVIRVLIIGDASKLTKSLDQAQGKVGGFGTSVGKIGAGLVALGAVKIGFDFAQDAIAQADRLGDAIQRLNIQLGPAFTDKLQATASGFRDIGASSQDILELEANFADVATALGVTDPAIASLSENVAATAQAISLLENVDPTTVVEQIGKAGTGSTKAMQALGVSWTDAEVAARALRDTGKGTADSLTAGDLAAARYSLTLEQLAPKLDAAKNSTGDLEIQQKRLDAAAEELQAKLGGPLSDALASVLGFINDEIDAIPGAIQGFESLGAVIDNFARTVLGPLGNVRDVLDSILGGLGDVGRNAAGFINGIGRAPSESDITRAIQNNDLRNGMGRGG